ncbi:hypothetical protein B4168_2852 [Anoxybacillus flavithermus]|nr:hypothetical protein B4168_2852 [Anoxybacillus flavithermus]OAO84908.1 hypothetical protein GT23_3294 [Parageobacillus thermoglucosidasius]
MKYATCSGIHHKKENGYFQTIRTALCIMPWVFLSAVKSFQK